MMGRPWKYKLPEVGKLIRRHEDADYVTSEMAVSLAADLVKLLREKASNIFGDARLDMLDILDEFENVVDVEGFDFELTNLFDWADIHRVWLGDGID